MSATTKTAAPPAPAAAIAVPLLPVDEAAAAGDDTAEVVLETNPDGVVLGAGCDGVVPVGEVLAV